MRFERETDLKKACIFAIGTIELDGASEWNITVIKEYLQELEHENKFLIDTLNKVRNLVI